MNLSVHLLRHLTFPLLFHLLLGEVFHKFYFIKHFNCHLYNFIFSFTVPKIVHFCCIGQVVCGELLLLATFHERLIGFICKLHNLVYSAK